MQLRAPNALKANSSYGALRSFSAFLPGDESVRSRKRIYRNPPGSALNIEAFALKRYRQKKSDMDVLREFQKSLEGRRPSTIRLYMAGARAAIEAAKPNIAEYGSYAELLPRIRENPPKGRIRIKPFLRFLAAAEANNSISSCDLQVTEDWVIQAVKRHMRAQKNPSIATRRDLALIASLCCGPARGNPVSGRKIASISAAPMCFCGERGSRSPPLPWPCASGMHGENGWLDPIKGGSIARRVNGAIQNSFSPDLAGGPWGEQLCITRSGDSWLGWGRGAI